MIIFLISVRSCCDDNGTASPSPFNSLDLELLFGLVIMVIAPRSLTGLETARIPSSCEELCQCNHRSMIQEIDAEW